MPIGDVVRRGFGTGGLGRVATAGYWAGAEVSSARGRHYDDVLQLTLLRRETTYDVVPDDWSAAAVSMQDFDDSAPHEEWNDVLSDNDTVVHGAEYPTIQEIVRQSVLIHYA